MYDFEELKLTFTDAVLCNTIVESSRRQSLKNKYVRTSGRRQEF